MYENRKSSPMRMSLYAVVLLATIVSLLGVVRPPKVYAATSQISPHLVAFDVISENQGWVQLDNTLYWTDDNGANWVDITPVLPSKETILVAQFADSQNGWVLWQDASNFYLSHTVNGKDWNTQTFNLSSDTDLPVEQAWMFWPDTQTGWISVKWASGVNFSIGTLWHTENGGLTWYESPLPLGEPVYFVDSQHGWIAGGPADNEFFYTNDAGKSWSISQPFAQTDTSISFGLPSYAGSNYGILPVIRSINSSQQIEFYATLDGYSWDMLYSSLIEPNSGASPFAWMGPKMAFMIVGNDMMHFNDEKIAKIATDPFIASITEIDMFSESFGWGKWEKNACERDTKAAVCTSTTRLMSTSNGGQSWKSIPLPSNYLETTIQSFASEINSAEINNPSAAISPSVNTQLITGHGFDKCEIATASQMQSWQDNSPYVAVNLYIGGARRACSNSALSASYLSQLSQQGWKFIPTWVGPQSSCWSSNTPQISLDLTTAYNQGVSEANAAIARLSELGLTSPSKTGSVIYYDLEGNSAHSGSTSCRNAAKAFINGWVAQIHSTGNKAGVYGSSCASAISDFSSISNVPDVIWPAATYASGYDSGANTSVPCVSDSLWSSHQRIRQYALGHAETWGGVSLNIDSDVIDGMVAIVDGGSNDVVPSGFNLLLSNIGVAIYKKDYAGGQPDYVQRVHLDKGASVKLLHGGVVGNGTGGGAFGGNNPTFNRTSLSTAWNSFSSSTYGAFCITNGQFFSMQDPAPLAFSLKKDGQVGQILSDGYGSTTEYPGQLYMLEIWSDHADIRPLSKSALYGSTAPNILAGLSENADKGPSNYVGRTFAGIDDTNNDGLYETILIFNSSYARQTDASTVLRNFGADKVIMFDGGGSTQLRCGSNSYVSSSRTVPQTIGVVKGPVFSDVPTSFWAGSYIERLYSAGVTGGCTSSPLQYCPTNSVSRAQMAVFILRAKHGSTYSPPSATGYIFNDVPSSYWAAPWIEQMAAEGITGGCASGYYCPEKLITRGEMAVLLLRAKHGNAYNPPSANGIFTDVPVSYWAAAWIEQLAAEGITGGCGSNAYCPNAFVSRAEMAVFIVKTFSLP